jgi:hypothetical protein
MYHYLVHFFTYCTSYFIYEQWKIVTVLLHSMLAALPWWLSLHFMHGSNIQASYTALLFGLSSHATGLAVCLHLKIKNIQFLFWSQTQNHGMTWPQDFHEPSQETECHISQSLVKTLFLMLFFSYTIPSWKLWLLHSCCVNFHSIQNLCSCYSLGHSVCVCVCVCVCVIYIG